MKMNFFFGQTISALALFMMISAGAGLTGCTKTTRPAHGLDTHVMQYDAATKRWYPVDNQPVSGDFVSRAGEQTLKEK